MLPVITTTGPFALTSFGLFMALALLVGAFVVWRLANVYDLDPEKTLDIIFLTFFSGLLGARLSYVILNLSEFGSPLKIILLNRYPGLIFWGGFILASFALIYLSRRLNLSFWILADLVTAGLFAGLSIGSVGCLLAGCLYGQPSSLILAVSQVGLIEKRFPIQIFYSIFFFLSFLYLWRSCLKFHFEGKILSMGLIFLGIITFVMEFFQEATKIYGILSLNHIFALASVFLGSFLFYWQNKKSFKKDFRALIAFFVNAKARRIYLSKLAKDCYNLKVNLKINYVRFKARIIKNLNVKANPPKF